jgi:hypothetical protein
MKNCKIRHLRGDKKIPEKINWISLIFKPEVKENEQRK